ncbi:MAG: DUF2953 domain-containing protein [Pseudomonadota bacterium]
MLAALLWTLAALVGAVLLAVLILLATPLRLEGQLNWPSKAPLTVRLKLLGGLTPWIKLPSIPEAAKKPRKEPKERAWRPSAASISRMAGAAPSLIGACFKRIQFGPAEADLEFGFDDPAETGQLFGHLSPLLHGGGPVLPIALTVRPNFQGQVFAANASGSLSLTPITLVPPLIGFAGKVWWPWR